MLWKTHSFLDEVARNDVEIEQLRNSLSDFNIHDAYKPITDPRYSFAPYSQQYTTNVPTDSTDRIFTQSSWPNLNNL